MTVVALLVSAWIEISLFYKATTAILIYMGT